MRGPWLRSIVAALVAAAGLLGCSGPAAPDTSWDGGVGCASCHMGDYPAGHVGKKPTTCGICHGQDAWHPTGTHHDFWPLTGKHEKTACYDCHTGTPPVFPGTKKACVACHLAVYDKAPNHPGHFAQTCEDCHSTTAWKPLLPTHAQTANPQAPSGSAGAASSEPGEKPVPTNRPAPGPLPAPRPKPTAPPAPTPTPSPAPPPPSPKPQPTVEPTSNASKRY